MTGRTAAILGMGQTGAAWAKALDAAGWEIRVFDPSDLIGGNIPKGPSVRRMKAISATVREAQWIIIALPQRVELIRIGAKLEHGGPRTVCGQCPQRAWLVNLLLPRAGQGSVGAIQRIGGISCAAQARQSL